MQVLSGPQTLILRPRPHPRVKKQDNHYYIKLNHHVYAYKSGRAWEFCEII